MSPVSARLHHRETKSAENVSQECIVHSWESKEAENAADEIIRKPKEYNTALLIGHYLWFFYSAAAMHSISTRAPFGRVLTAKAQRAGNGALKNSE